jgi:hypothetical protein
LIQKKITNALKMILKYDLAVIILILIGSAIFIYPFIRIVHYDPEEFWTTVISTVSHARAVFAGYYPFWTSDFGFGIPVPFFTNLNYHPFFWLFALNPGFAIIFLYFLHMFIGSYGTWRLCKRFNIVPWIALICVLTFMLSSASLNNLYNNFWLPHFISWTSAPFLTLFCINLLFTPTRKKANFYAIALGLGIGLTGLSSHPPMFFFICIFLALLTLGNFRQAVLRWRELLIALVIAILICGSEMAYILQQYLAFDQSLSRPYKPFDLGIHAFWSIFIRPISLDRIPHLAGIVPPLDWKLSRWIFIGPVFAWVSLASIFFWRRISSVKISLYLPFLFFSLLYAFDPKFVYTLVSGPVGHCDALILIGILLAGSGLSWIARRNKIFTVFTILLCLAQTSMLLINFAPSWESVNKSHKSATLKTVLNGTNQTALLVKEIGVDGARVLISPAIEDRLDSQELMNLGLSRNSLPYDGIRVVNGVFKGISYNPFCKDVVTLVGRITNNACSLENKNFLDISGVKYILKYRDEHYQDKSVFVANVYENRSNRTLALFQNPDAWDEANYMDSSIFTFDLCPGQAQCAKDMFASDFSGVIPLRQTNHARIEVSHKYGDIFLKLVPESQENALMVSEYSLPGWKAYATGPGGEIEIPVTPVLKNFIGLRIPPLTTAVHLMYRPSMRILLEVISLFSMFFFTLVFLWKFKEIYFHRHA